MLEFPKYNPLLRSSLVKLIILRWYRSSIEFVDQSGKPNYFPGQPSDFSCSNCWQFSITSHSPVPSSKMSQSSSISLGKISRARSLFRIFPQALATLQTWTATSRCSASGSKRYVASSKLNTFVTWLIWKKNMFIDSHHKSIQIVSIFLSHDMSKRTWNGDTRGGTLPCRSSCLQCWPRIVAWWPERTPAWSKSRFHPNRSARKTWWMMDDWVVEPPLWKIYESKLGLLFHIICHIYSKYMEKYDLFQITRWWQCVMTNHITMPTRGPWGTPSGIPSE